MHERGMLKWAPFNALIDGDECLTELNKVTRQKTRPILSEDQIAEIEENIKEAFYTKEIITISYYCQGDMHDISGQITHIDIVNKIITLNHQDKIYFKNILKVHKKTLDY